MRRMKVVATILLIAALAGAIISWPFRDSFWGGLALAAFEASLVGALADWFAVVALFRHPLGLRFIPHTAIIPNNRNRIIDSIVYMVENQWLRLDVIKSKVQEYNILEKVCTALQSDEGRKRLEALISSVLLNTIQNMEPEQIAHFIRTLIKDNFSEVKVSPELIKKLEKSIKELYSDDIIDFIVDGAKDVIYSEDFLIVTRTTLRKAADDYSRKGFLRRLGRGIGESLDLINYAEAAGSLVSKLGDLLEGMKSRNNPNRSKIKQGFENLSVFEQGNITAALENWLNKIIHADDGQKIVADMVGAAKHQLFQRGIEDSPVIKYLADITIIQLNLINSDQARKLQFEGWIKQEVVSIVERYHSIIGRIVRENLQSLNDKVFVESLEDRVGEDLQWIRVNGTVIGAVVGIVQYLILNMLR